MAGPNLQSPTLTNILLSTMVTLLVAVIIGGLVFWKDMLVFQNNTNNEFKQVTTYTTNKFALIYDRFKKLEQTKQQDVSQNRQLSKHWVIHNWTLRRLNELRIQHNMSLLDWPKLGSSPNYVERR